MCLHTDLTSCDVLCCVVLCLNTPACRTPRSLQAPRGAFIIPDIVSACRQGYTDGDRFDPDRFRWVGGAVGCLVLADICCAVLHCVTFSYASTSLCFYESLSCLRL